MPELSWSLRGNRILLDLLVLRAGDPGDMTSVSGRALLDTGATASGIGPDIVERLNLTSYGKNG
jgi:hypothetical protein